MDLRGRTQVFSPIMLGCILPLHDIPSARRISTTVRSPRQKRCGCFAVKACNSGDERELGAGGPNMVDADMILLRKRIFELKRQENNYESPQDWMEWEKKWQGEYHSGVFRTMEWLQFNLINTRPAVGMALVGLVCVGVPACAVISVFECVIRLMALTGKV